MKISFLAVGLALAACAGPRQSATLLMVRESPSEIVARASASFPEEVEDQTEASVLACQGAASRGQTALLNHALMKKTPSGRRLAEAEIPSIEVQRHVRTLVTSAQVVQTSVRDKSCTVTLSMSKSELRAVLKEAK